MPRKGHIAKREVVADPVYASTLVTKFVNSMMWGGKKSTAQKIFYASMTGLEAKGGGDDALKLFKKAVENVKPLLEVKTCTAWPRRTRPSRTIAGKRLIRFSRSSFFVVGEPAAGIAPVHL